MDQSEQASGVNGEEDRKPSIVWKSDTHRIVRWWQDMDIMAGIQQGGWTYALEAAQPRDTMGNEAWLRIKFKDANLDLSPYEWGLIVGSLMQGIVDLRELDVTHGSGQFS